MIKLLYEINQILSSSSRLKCYYFQTKFWYSLELLLTMIEFPLNIFRQTGCTMSSQVSLVCTRVFLKHSPYISLSKYLTKSGGLT